MKRVIMAFIIAVLLTFVFSVYASGEEYLCDSENDVLSQNIEFVGNSMFSVQYTNIGAISAILSIDGDNAYCNGSIQTSTSGASTSISVRLQRSTNGTSWATIKTWSGNGTSSSDVSGQYTVSSGFQYRVSVYGSVQNQNGSVLESATKYSSVKTH